MSQAVVVLGSTGSIGTQTLDVLARHADDFTLHAITANRNWQLLAEQCITYQPIFAALADKADAAKLAHYLKANNVTTEVLAGADVLCQLVADSAVDTVVTGIVGAAGVAPTLAAANAGKRLLLANKEALVVAGSLVLKAVKGNHAELIPLDSEHSAIYQCLPADKGLTTVSKLLLTASGGPFRGWSREQLAEVTVEQALAHPNWTMGPKISVDSATLMNKGLELIEACWLFDVTPAQVEVVVHPQSVIHSMVQYVDGAVMAQLGRADMRTAIAFGLSHPSRMTSGVEPMDFSQLSELNFEKPDVDVFPCLSLAKQAMDAGGSTTAVLNAANETVVAAFLKRDIGFTRIPELVERALTQVAAPACDTVADLMAVDKEARRFVRQQIGEKR